MTPFRKSNPSDGPSERPSASQFRHKGEIVGFRSWGLNERYRLQSPIQKGEWPLEPEKATSAWARSTAGWYAYYSLEMCANQEFKMFKGQQIDGAIVAWGEAFLHPSGFRAEYARVACLCYEPHWPKPFIAALRAIADEYRAQLVTHNDLKRIAGEYGDVIGRDYYESLPSNMYPAVHDW